jgi:hypothetical protein
VALKTGGLTFLVIVTLRISLIVWVPVGKSLVAWTSIYYHKIEYGLLHVNCLQNIK